MQLLGLGSISSTSTVRAIYILGIYVSVSECERLYAIYYIRHYYI